MDASPAWLCEYGVMGQRADTHVEDRELSQDRPQLFVERVLRKLDFAHVEIPYTTDLEVFVDDLHARRQNIRRRMRRSMGIR